ncbi:hypothetical protein E4U41_007819 [Claviceps citrina]|nr:hypothetical protein E4U41_007819 [Claviceps citrina]
MECIVCKKTPPQVNIKRCAKCHLTPYCSRECQKSDWKTHKKACGDKRNASSGSGSGSGASASSSASASASASANLSPPKGLERGITNPFTRLDDGTWLHNRPERDVYGLLIDTYRLRMEDDYKLGGEAHSDSMYAGRPDGRAGFRRFLTLAESRPGLLPPWWTPDKRRSCEALGAAPDQWYSLGQVVEKGDITERYGDARFPMQLRMFGEAVYGTAPGGTGGTGGTAMRRMMMMMEQGSRSGGMQTTLMDVSSMMGRR